MTVKIYKNFLSEEECNALNQVTLDAVKNKWVGTTVEKAIKVNGHTEIVHGYTKRLSTRNTMKDIEYPKIVLDISEKIRKFLGIDTFPIIDGHGRDGIVTSITYTGGQLYPHYDGRSMYNLPAYRCNVLTQATEEGCDLYVGGKKIDIEVGDLHCYMASEVLHSATEAMGKTPRIMWMFGAHIPKEHWSEYGLS